ncbi:efflux RND transporter periplasmic adaptor subunit [Roseiconus lacunae]|uniref:Efflux RND transporter periplasmic adaptor subunit n=1 Tax=Roseiconus lacunae TaxID=2605694 RepID=A0ABT7PQN1_9BACT|nr:efflux RND transporter periplasmic adaptor subunit [Roseiconus lacunae]MDM4018808.1 efflux RND transporter periplasmic adaptor subunit [Roseiconus lacunae]
MRTNLLLAAFVAVGSLSMTGVGNVNETVHNLLGVATERPERGTEIHASSATIPSHSDDHGVKPLSSEGHHAKHKIVVTSPLIKDVTLTQPYVCQIHSRRHIEICALEGGYLNEILVNEGQRVSKGQAMFRILPTLYEARLEADLAEAELAQVEFDNTQSLVEQNIVSNQELKLSKAKLGKAQANVKLARAEMNFAEIKAPFDGIVDRLKEQEGSLVDDGAMLTTMSDNSVMWVYFNVPESAYLEYQTALNNGQSQNSLSVQLQLANHSLFDQIGSIGAIEADFDSETGNIAFRADFPNPHGLLRHGQTGTVLINRTKTDAIVIPQRSKFEILTKTYVFVVGPDNVVHQREIVIEDEQEDIFLIEKGLMPNDRILVEGIRQVRDGETIAYDYHPPEAILANLKFHAE